MKLIISPSIMVCKITELEDYIGVFEDFGIDSIHFDVMDGHFVNNIMLGTNFYEDLKSMTKIPIDIHLMTEKPEQFVSYFKLRPGDRVCFHPETTWQAFKLLQTIKDKQCYCGIALNPGTSIYYIDELYQVLDYVTLMMVNPGFAGQTLVPNGLLKIKRVRSKLEEHHLETDIFVDGNTTPENARQMYEQGANGIIVGTSSIVKSVNYFRQEYNNYISYIMGSREV